MKQELSPNFTNKRGQYKPEIVVIHIMAGSLAGTVAWFKNPASQVSSHYGVGLNGEVVQFVKEEDTAWANGRVNNPTSKIVKEKGGNPNNYSISIEHEGYDLSKAPQSQIDASKELIKDICERNGIPLDRDHVIGHYEIYSLKPNCPSTDKTIIDKLIESTMNKDFVKAVSTICGKDYGENLNEKEQEEASKKLAEVVSSIGTLRKEIENAKISLNQCEQAKVPVQVNGLTDATLVDLLRELRNRILKF